MKNNTDHYFIEQYHRQRAPLKHLCRCVLLRPINWNLDQNLAFAEKGPAPFTPELALCVGRRAQPILSEILFSYKYKWKPANVARGPVKAT